jgi:tetratricopeptide (TPR) repeat protein
MKKLLVVVITLQYILANSFGLGYDNREILKHENILIQYQKVEEDTINDTYLYILNAKEKVLFDIYQFNGGEIHIKNIKIKNNLYAILEGVYNYIPNIDNNCGIDALVYRLNIYKKYNLFLLKIFIDDKTLNGEDGTVMCKKSYYPYQKNRDFLNKLNNLRITNSVILNSLEIFLKSNYSNIYDSKFTFKESRFNLNVLKTILNDISVNKKTLTPYNNIAYYLQKAGSNKEAIYLLEKILKKYPTRTVAHYNLADAYWALGEKKKAIVSYTTYIEQMCNAGKEKRIPKVVRDRVSSK